MRAINRVQEAAFINLSKFHFASCSMWFLSPLRRQQIIGPRSKVAINFLKVVDQS